MARRYHRVYKTVNKRLTILGADRRLFFLALGIGGATFNLFGSLLAGAAMFLFLHLFALGATRRDPELLRILLNAARYRTHYCPTKFAPVAVARSSHAQEP